MTNLDDTRHCLMCEDSAKKILELEQRVKVLNQTPQQTAAQIERGHVEWMMKLPVAFTCTVRPLRGDESIASFNIKWANNLPIAGNFVAIPQLPKQSDSSETDLDEALRRQ